MSLILSDKWDNRFLEMAGFVANWSKDPSTKCGAIVTDRLNRIIGLGYNGFPRGISDMQSRLDNREEKYSRVIHAEINAILNSNGSVRDCSLFTFPLPPCDRCAGFIIQSGIKRVVSPHLPIDKVHWAGSVERSLSYFKEAGVEILLV